MISYKCDNCGNEIPIIKKEIFGEETEVLDCGRVKCEQWSVETIFDYYDITLCKSCAQIISAQIDYELLKVKTEVLQGEKNYDWYDNET